MKLVMSSQFVLGKERKPVMKLTKMTASAFNITTKTKIYEAYHLLTEMKFSYVYKQFLQMKFWKSSLTKRGKEVGVTFTLISGCHSSSQNYQSSKSSQK